MILVAGGAGYIGSHTLKQLAKKYQTVTFDNLCAGHRENVKWGMFFEGDLADIESLRNCFRENAITAVMHFCAFANVGESVKEPEKYYQNNVANTLNLLSVMREFGVSYFIFSSTCATYGNPTTLTLSETHPQNPVNPYGTSKLMVEKIVKDYAHAYGIKYGFLRYFNAAGADPDGEIGEAHDPETHLIPLAIYAAQKKRDKLTIFGDDYPTSDGTCIRDYIHVNDLAKAHISALDHLKKGHENIELNLGTGVGYSVREIIAAVEKITGLPVPYEMGPRREGDPAVLVADNKKAKDVLGWEPTFTLEQIVQTAWQWHNK